MAIPRRFHFEHGRIRMSAPPSGRLVGGQGRRVNDPSLADKPAEATLLRFASFAPVAQDPLIPRHPLLLGHTSVISIDCGAG
jgi:hypothetical protein